MVRSTLKACAEFGIKIGVLFVGTMLFALSQTPPDAIHREILAPFLLTGLFVFLFSLIVWLSITVEELRDEQK